MIAAQLKTLADRLETIAGASTSANDSEGGYWKRIAAAAETISGSSSTANNTVQGYMLRTAKALETETGADPTGKNVNEQGYLARMVAAIESDTGASTGSLEGRLVVAANLWSADAVTPANTVAPRLMDSPVDGSVVTAPIVGQTLYFDPGTWSGSPNTFTVQLYADDVAVPGTDFTVAAGDPWETYVVFDTEEDAVFKLGVIGTNGAGSSSEVFSTPTSPAEGIAPIDVELTRTSADGVTPMTYTIDWGRAQPDYLLRARNYTTLAGGTYTDEATIILEPDDFDLTDIKPRLAAAGFAETGSAEYLEISIITMSPAGIGYQHDATRITPQAAGGAPTYWSDANSNSAYVESGGGLVTTQPDDWAEMRVAKADTGGYGYFEVTPAGTSGVRNLGIGLCLAAFSTTAPLGDGGVDSIAFYISGDVQRWSGSQVLDSAPPAYALGQVVGVDMDASGMVNFYVDGVHVAGPYDMSASFGTNDALPAVCCNHGHNFTINGSGPFVRSGSPRPWGP